MRLVKLFAVLFSAACFVGCASVSVRDVQRVTTPMPTRMPEKIYVAPFTFTAETLRVDRAGVDLDAFKAGVQQRFNAAFKNSIERLGPTVVPLGPGEHAPRSNDWLVTGNFDRIHQGSRLLRAVVGLGAGGTKMEVTATVFDLSQRVPRPFLQVRTTGGSNISPGVTGVATIFLSGPMALTNLLNAVDGVRSGVSFDAARTARQVAAVISQVMVEQRMIPAEKAKSPKRLGELPGS